MPSKSRRHIVLPDTQIKPGVSIDHIRWVSQYIVEKRPDVLVLIGDWADMPSLSSYDKGKKSFEGRTYKADVAAANEALRVLMEPIEAEIKRREANHKARWNLRRVVTLGNHEDRINRMIELHRELEGTYSTDDLEFAKWGFEVYPFLHCVVVDGVAYSHFFPSGQMGKPITTARALLTKCHMSCVAGHQQGRDIAFDKRPDGTTLTGIIAGSFYTHQEQYLGPQGNLHWRGFHVLNDVRNGCFEEMPITIDYLQRRYGQAEGGPG